ncbi:MAG: 50S ribosomal protein L3 N(5)-glutamine methyltransferase [Hyphomicrobium sp.]|jgi:ribosomal protein L3 glutamine methyltransferase|nr:50S ribosomal protein L3 N(5)-glutamine methyltransferase [Hyphomicrobium sp.]
MSPSGTDGPIHDLHTVRDWLRHGVSRFRGAHLVFGHGTSTPVDEAAFLILSALDLPVDQLDPWLDCRLTAAERAKIATLFDLRITTRKPAPYLVNRAYIRGRDFYVDERVIVPRSYIGELLDGELATVVPDAESVTSVLDLCTGSGCLAIIAALTYPNAIVDAIDLSADALEVARRNVADYGLEERITLQQSDLFTGLGTRRYDLIISNPPYVSADAIAAFPPEYKAEPVMAHAGGADGLDLVRRIIAEAPRHLERDGVLVVEVGTGLDILEEEFPNLPFLWLETEDSSGEVFALTAAELQSSQPDRRSRTR